MKELLDRIESCNYECEAGPLTGNVDWLELREKLNPIIEKEEREKSIMSNYEITPVYNKEGEYWSFHVKDKRSGEDNASTKRVLELTRTLPIDLLDQPDAE